MSAPATLYSARLFHKRFAPKVHEFSYDLWALRVDLSALEDLAEQNLLGGRSPLSLDPKDFGGRDDGPMTHWFEDQLKAHGFSREGPKEFLFLPRFKGRGFSPLSVWSSPEALLFEVHNTSGEAHSYLLPREDLGQHQAWKRLWVSPFSDMHGRYTFGHQADETRLDLSVRLHDGRGQALIATLGGVGQPLTNESLKQVLRSPGIGGARSFQMILWQALKLRRRGLRPKWGPFAPRQIVSQAVPLKASTSTSALGKSEIGGTKC